MSEPFLAEVRIVGFNLRLAVGLFVTGKFCRSIRTNPLYSLLGTTYGGDGRTSFALPDMRGRTPIHVGNSNGGAFHTEGQKSGEETHTLSGAEMPNHDHVLQATNNNGATDQPQGKVLATAVGATVYGEFGAQASMASGTVSNVGGGQAHDNMQPYLAINFCIALQGLFPSRN